MSRVWIDPTKHRVKDTPVARLFRRLLKFPGLFTYWNSKTGQWILAYWIHERARLADEVEDLGAQFEEVTPAFIQMIAHCWRPVDWEAKKRSLRSKERDQQRKEDDSIMENQERYAWLQERLKIPVPYSFTAGFKGGQ